LPADAVGAPDQNAGLTSVVCPAAGSCAAAGYYVNAGGFQPMVAAESGGAWAAPQGVGLPADALAANQDAGLNSLACAAQGTCAAVGYYKSSSGYHAMTVAETGGAWGTPQKLALPADAIAMSQDAALNLIACPAPGSCVAVGYYKNSNGHQAMT